MKREEKGKMFDEKSYTIKHRDDHLSKKYRNVKMLYGSDRVFAHMSAILLKYFSFVYGTISNTSSVIL